MRILVAIPTYNNPETILDTATATRRVHPHVVVVDDGSTRLPERFEETLQEHDIALLRHEKNQGKGAAALTAARSFPDFDYLITMDADGQHDQQDLPAFVHAIETQGQNHDLLVIGCRDFNTPNVPKSSRFGRSFSNFWVKLETGKTLQDTQSGFKAYPIQALSRASFLSRRYAFEVESTVRLLWGGLKLCEIPIKVTYAPPDQRISHFLPIKDNVRLSLLHSWLCIRRIIPWPHPKLV